MALRFHHLTREYVKVPVSGISDGAAIDPTASAVELAIVDGDPGSGDWATGEWETDATRNPARYYARLLVGPDSPFGALNEGNYDVYVRITDDPERPVLRAGMLTIT